MKKRIVNAINSYFRAKNKELFYGDFLAGSGNRFELFLLDLTKKDFYKVFLKYSRRNPSQKEKNFKKLEKDKYDSLLAEFNQNGIVILNSYFNSEVDRILSEYRDFFSIIEPNKNDYKRLFSFPIEESLLEDLLTPDLLSLLCEYKKTQLYLRSCPGLNITYPGFKDITTREIKERNYNETGFANFFHLDTPHLVQYHILLKDVGMNDPHMLYAKKSNHTYFGMHYRIATEEFVTNNYEIVHCIGSKGTVYLFDGGSGMHRMFATEYGYRMTMDFMFTPGNSILKDSCPISNIDSMTFENFSDLQLESLKFLR
jgi:hypothetical protein